MWALPVMKRLWPVDEILICFTTLARINRPKTQPNLPGKMGSLAVGRSEEMGIARIVHR